MGGSVKYNIDAFAKELGVDLGDVALLFLNYINEMKEEVASMHACLGEGNLDMLQRVVHNIKGVSGNLAIHDVYDHASVFDGLLKEKKADNPQKYVLTLEKMLESTEIEIKKYFSDRGYSL